MRAVIQRVSRARVTVDSETVGEIGKGLVVLLGVATGDGEEAAHALARKVVRLRIFPDPATGKMARSVADAGGSVLVVSQFTLYGDCNQGLRPSFTRAAPPAPAEALYRTFIAAVADEGVTVAEGRFGAMMAVELVGDGPVTLLLDSERTF